MSNNKQSSVEWLVSSLLQYIHEAHHPEIVELYEQAKAMHKQEIIDAGNYQYYLTGEQYYNEKYGS